MTPERWRRITGIFHAAREREPGRRDAFVAEACRDDPTLRREVEAMLVGLEDAGQFGETPLFASASGPEPGSSPGVVQLAPGSHLGPYQILGLLGAGGMGQVYRARDTKLGRDVALKILPDALARDPDRLARFQREAKTLASLNHPNIGGIHGLEEADPSTGSGQAAVLALVLELVDGDDLSQRIAR